jgi:hypothetical protein
VVVTGRRIVELGRSDVDGDARVDAGLVTGALDARGQELQRSRFGGSTGPRPPSSAISAVV